MGVNNVNKTTGALTKIAGLFNSLKIDLMYSAFPSNASASNKLITEAEIGVVTETQYSEIQSLLS